MLRDNHKPWADPFVALREELKDSAILFDPSIEVPDIIGATKETVARLQGTMSAGDSPMAGKGPFGRPRGGKA